MEWQPGTWKSIGDCQEVSHEKRNSFCCRWSNVVGNFWLQSLSALHLDLYCNDIAEVGTQHLIQALLGLQSLSTLHLYLMGNNIGDVAGAPEAHPG